MTRIDAQAILCNGIAEMNLSLPPETIQKLLEYAILMAKWSQAYNLTTIRSLDRIIPVHILDSLSLVPHLLNKKNVLDVGAGAGLPGIPLALVYPEVVFTLLDSQQKKVSFMQHVITSLGLSNVTVVQQRIEALQVSYPFDMVVARAFASLDEFVKLIINVCDNRTVIVAMKAKRDVVVQEAQHLPANFELVNIETVAVPGIDAERCLVFLKKKEGSNCE